jgi:glutathione S-transferase
MRPPPAIRAIGAVGTGRDAILFFRLFLKNCLPVLKLIATPTSPYVRKVRIALAEKKIEYQTVDAAPYEPGNPVHAWSPLGKVPVLVLDDGTHLFDSRVIVEYIDTVSPVSRLIPEPNRQRIEVKRWEALADGICDAAQSIVMESRRPAKQQSKDWIERQRQKVAAGVAELARELEEKSWCDGESYTLADIAAGCALGYLDLRCPELDWRRDYPNLARLAEKLAKRPSFQETAPPMA